jgi:hypothetical protein
LFKESCTPNTTLADAYATLVVPDTKPVLLLIVTPVGNVPELTLYVYGAYPPDTLANGLKLDIAEP